MGLSVVSQPLQAKLCVKEIAHISLVKKVMVGGFMTWRERERETISPDSIAKSSVLYEPVEEE